MVRVFNSGLNFERAERVKGFASVCMYVCVFVSVSVYMRIDVTKERKKDSLNVQLEFVPVGRE